MKEIIDDIKAEGFTRREVIIYGIVAPIVLVLLCGIASTIS